MERDNPKYQREFERKLYNNDRNDSYYNERNNYYNDQYDRDRDQNRSQSFENYRDRYSNSRGNYYGMNDENAEYRNVRSSGSNAYGGGPVGGYGASSYRGISQDRDQDSYHYGDPNPYMGNRRSEGGYERTRGTGWNDRDEHSNSRGSNYNSGSSDRDRYSRQDNSYRYGGEGRRYEDFNRDEDNKSYRSRDESYNMLGIDAYYDRGDQPRSARGADYDRNDRQNFYEAGSERDDYSSRREIRRTERDRSSDRDDNYATGLYASNRSYVSDNDDYSTRSSRYRRPGETSGPDYRADSGISSYGRETSGA